MIRANPPHEWRTVPVDGRRLRQIRAERGLSQEDLAYKASLGLTTIRTLECKAQATCRAWTLDLIAAALETLPQALSRPDGSPKAASPAERTLDNNVLAIDAAKSRRPGHAS